MTTDDTPLPSPPFIDIPGLRNFRDAGGYPVVTSSSSPSSSSAHDQQRQEQQQQQEEDQQPKRMVRRGILFRASEPSKVTDDGVRRMTDELHIAKVYDLRSQTEIDRDTAAGGRHVREWAGAERVFAPVFGHEDYSPEAIAMRFSNFSRMGSEGFVQVYTRILEAAVRPTGHQPFALILRHLAGTTTAAAAAAAATDGPNSLLPPAPILVHCTAGKDRTGVIVALVLSLCGVSDDAVAHEYSLTDLGLKERKEEFISHLIQAPPLLNDREGAARMVSSRRENMRDTLAMIRARWGGVEQFVVQECGLSPEEVGRIRENLVVELGEGERPIDWEEHSKLMP